MPYYRESRRLVGITTISERDILPMDAAARVAALPINSEGEMQAIALGNYANDHHYPGFEMPLAPKSIQWGGRWTGTAFTIPYEALIPQKVDGLLACEKNISVSHIANGATRLQPVVLGIGQAAGMAAALCVEQGCDPRALSVRSLQNALISDPVAPAAVVPLFNVPPHNPQWRTVQSIYVNQFNKYSSTGYHPLENLQISAQSATPSGSQSIALQGKLQKTIKNQYKLYQTTHKTLPNCITLVTVIWEITDSFLSLLNNQQVHVMGTWNSAGKWLLCTQINPL